MLNMMTRGVLGLQQIDQVWVVRSLRLNAKELAIVDRHNAKRRFTATRIAEEGLFEAQLEGVSEAFDYLLEITTWSGETFQISDPILMEQFYVNWTCTYTKSATRYNRKLWMRR
jgi:hypothetical protein